MTDPGPSGGGDAAPVAEWRGALIDVVAGDLASIEADVAIVGICSQVSTRQSIPSVMDGLDQALGGAIARLRADWVFEGSWGETLLLSSPPAPVKAGNVLLLGLGDTASELASHVRRALRVAAGQALNLGASTVAFAPANIDTGSSRFNAIATGRSVLQGISDAISQHPGRVRRWSFVAEPQDVAQIAEIFRVAFSEVVND